MSRFFSIFRFFHGPLADRPPRRRGARRWAAAALLPWLAACGGGGDGAGGGEGGGNPPPAPLTAEGLWRGTTSDGQDATLLILGDGRTWGFFTRDAALTGALSLRLQQAGNDFSVAGSGLGLGYTLPAGSFSGQVRSGQSLGLDFSNGAHFELAYATAYASPASLAAIAGSYSVAGRTATHTMAPTPLRLDAQGRFSLGGAGCAMDGNLRPAADGKGYFDTRVTLSGSCGGLPAGTVLEGVALVDGTARPRTLLAFVAHAEAGYVLTLQGSAAAAP